MNTAPAFRNFSRAVARAFTLVEVILAILIISAIMTVLLYFYQRSAEVRQNVIRETEYLSVSRMFLEQISSELRSARIVEDQFIGFEGGSNAITFVCTSIPQMARWITSTNDPVVLPPATDLKRVTYSLLAGTNVLGLDRTEELLTGSASNTLSLASTNAPQFAGDTNGLTNLPPQTPLFSAVNTTSNSADSNLFATNDLQIARQPLTDKIRYLRFRYWAGTNWVDTWSGLSLPAGVEITLGQDPMPAETTPGAAMPEPVEASISSASSAVISTNIEEYPYEFFRRVVYLPNSTPAALTAPAGDSMPPF